MHITLRANEKIFVNGAVLKVDRKTSIELMNDVAFLLEAHVMLEQDATTPLRQLYFIVQTMLMEPGERPDLRTVLAQHLAAMERVYDDAAIIDGLGRIAALTKRNRSFEALKTIRTLLPVEAAITGRPGEASVKIKPPLSVMPVGRNGTPALAEAC